MSKVLIAPPQYKTICDYCNKENPIFTLCSDTHYGIVNKIHSQGETLVNSVNFQISGGIMYSIPDPKDICRDCLQLAFNQLIGKIYED